MELTTQSMSITTSSSQRLASPPPKKSLVALTSTHTRLKSMQPKVNLKKPIKLGLLALATITILLTQRKVMEPVNNLFAMCISMTSNLRATKKSLITMDLFWLPTVAKSATRNHVEMSGQLFRSFLPKPKTS